MADNQTHHADKTAHDKAAAEKASADKAAAAKKDAQAASDKAAADAHEAQKRADEATAKAMDAGKTPEQREVEKALKEADDAKAKAAQAAREHAAAKSDTPTTVVQAGVIAPGVHDSTAASHHLAQKFGNDPENPKPGKPEHSDPELMTVRIERRSADADEGVVTALIHPDMLGDYLRAGWTQATEV